MKPCAGFSLVELVVSLAILGLLATMAVPTMEFARKRLMEHDLHIALQEIRRGIDAYKAAADEGKIQRDADATGYPPTLQALYEGVPNTLIAQPKKIFFIRRLPRDPFYPDQAAPAIDTWGKRSYASEYDRPSEGKDVYDVYSLSPDRALDGSSYREW